MIRNTQMAQGAFSFIQISVRDVSLLFSVALVPQLILLWITGSARALFIIAIALCASLLSEYLGCLLKKRNTFIDGTAVVEGLIAGMLLPQTYPMLLAFVIVFFAFFSAKQLFGGLAVSWVNPAVVAVAVACALGGTYFSDFLVSGNIAQTENISSWLFESGTINYLNSDAQITSFLNMILSFLGITVPEGYVTLFWDSQSVIPAFRFNVLTLCTSLLLLATKPGSWVIPTACLAVYALLVRFFSLTPFSGAIGQGDILVALLTGGIFFTVFFVLPWYGTIPFSFAGQCAYGVIAGIIIFCMNGYGTSSSGAIFSVLIMNSISPIIQLIERNIFTLRRKKLLQKKEKNVQNNT